MEQRLKLAASEFDQLVKTKGIFGLQPTPEAEDVMTTFNRKKPCNKHFSEICRLCVCDSNSIHFLLLPLLAFEQEYHFINSCFHAKNTLSSNM